MGTLGTGTWKLERAPVSSPALGQSTRRAPAWSREVVGAKPQAPPEDLRRARHRLSGSAAATATPHTSPPESSPLPTASNHYPAWSALNMQRRVMSCGSGSIRREQSSIYINVAWVGREGLKGWRRERWAGVYTTRVSAAVVGKPVSCSSLCPPSLLLS